MSGDVGAPVDIWDTNWPEGGYYWTVVPVEASAPPSITTTVGDPGADIEPAIPVASASGFAVGDLVRVGNATNQETLTVRGVVGNTLSLATTFKLAHGLGEPVARLAGNLRYRDIELGAGRVPRGPRDALRQEQRADTRHRRSAVRIRSVAEGAAGGRFVR